ncbi:MAG TPA: carbohydrate binding family 9 domain-containing protein [candidate division Zixibacteria bacterium]|nr:carbohydrate binding family 9 domain-containing protein [candidate division Zixibacteria bacterium]
MSYFRTALPQGILGILVGILLFATLSQAAFEPQYSPKMIAVFSEEAVKVDGQLNDRAWEKAARGYGFVERYPGDMVEPDVKTEVLLTYDTDNLYVAFICYDDPSQIRATMCQRDQFSSNDAVSLYIDTYGEASWAYQFKVNPYGVQSDRMWTAVHGTDSGFDVVWESAATVTDSGYQVELAVPFSSIRFPDRDVQSWKIDFWRERPRESYKQYSWSAYDRNDQCWVCQWGRLDGLKNVKPGRGLEFLQSLVANQVGERSDPEKALDESDIDGDLSLGAKYSLSSDITFEGTYNPDFSQIEADADQVDVNTTIALQYAERRPFFQEGSDIFRTLFNSFYTRTVNDPAFAVKGTGRMGTTNIGFLFAQDENSPYMIPLVEQSVMVNAGKSYISALRYSHTLGSGSSFGMILTDRRFDNDGSGTIMSVDGDLRISRNYRVIGQFIASHTKEPDNLSLTPGYGDWSFNDEEQTVALDGESYYGDAMILQVRRNSRAWNFTLNYDHTSPTYRTETGYDPWNDYRNLWFYTSYTYRYDNGLLEQLTPEANINQKWSYDGFDRNRGVTIGFNANLRLAQIYFGSDYSVYREVWGGVEFSDLWEFNLSAGSRPSDRYGFDLSFSRSRNVARWLVTIGNETDLAASMFIKPVDRITIEEDLSYSRSTHDVTGEELYDGYIARTRLQYQANKELSFRLVLQYNDFSRAWDVDPLLTYRIGSFSVLYLGSTLDYADFGGGEVYHPDGITTYYTDKWSLSQRQFFLKIQYLFQV